MDTSLPRRRSSARRGLQRPQSRPNFHRATPLQRAGRNGNSRVPARTPEQSFPPLPQERVGRSESLGCETYSGYRLSSSRTPSFFWQGLDIEIKGKLIGVRSHPHGIDLFLAFVLQPGLDHILGKDVPLEQKIMVLLQGVDLRLQFIEILVNRLGRFYLVPHPIQPRHQHRRKRKVGIAARIRRAKFYPLGLLTGRIHRYSYARAPVARRVNQVDRRLISRPQPAVGVRGRRYEAAQRMRMLDQPPNIVPRHLADQSISLLVIKKVLPPLP